MEQLRIKGFKCFTDNVIGLNGLTVLTGSNGAGKSSVIQALLLTREAIEHCSKLSAEKGIYEWQAKDISLNGVKQLQLGSYDDICNIDADNISISVNGADFIFEQGAYDGDVNVKLSDEDFSKLPVYMTQDEFYYLNAERIGPRTYSDILPVTSFLNSGERGELAGNVLHETSKTFPKVEKERTFEQEDTQNFNIQIDKWMSYLFSEVSVKPEPVTPNVCRIKLRGSRTAVIAPNTGFGYTYALPIIINGLIAKKGSLLIIENPEAHLHPKAQSNIGLFIGKMVAAGLKIIVETHSEHVVNGMRRAALSGFGLNPENVSIYFFTNTKDNCQYVPITMDEDGDLSDFPVDFFDQVRQDMMEIIRLAAKR